MSKTKTVNPRKIKKEFNHNEEKGINLAKIAWGKSMKDFYYPPLSEPNFVFDYTHKESFYIDPENQWKITMNLANVPPLTKDDEYVDFIHAIALHEISHYQIIPYDGLMNAKMLRAAIKHVNHHFAPVVVNVVADFIIDKKLCKKKPELMKWELSKTYNHLKDLNKNNLSDFSKFLFRSYELLFDIRLAEDDSLLSMDPLAKKVLNIINKDFENETLWEKKVTQVAYHLKGMVKDTFTLIGTGGAFEDNNVRRKTPGGKGGFIEFPEDILELMDNPLESKNRDKIKKDNDDNLKEKAEKFAKDIPYSEFGAPAGQAGILIDGNPLATWYRGISKNLIDIQILEEKPGGNLPVYPEPWRIGDPLDQLDVVQTLLTSPVVIPNVTTKKWTLDEGPGYLIEKQIPDLLLVVDSSGSMYWDYTVKKAKGQYHTALVASFAALSFAAHKGVKVSVINFSNRPDTCDWTTNVYKAERVLLRYQGGGTNLPTKAILKQCEKAENNVLVLIITDFGIYNWSASKKSMIFLVERGHKIVGFFIGSNKVPKDKFKGLMERVSFYPIKDDKDLINLVIKEVKKYYM